MHGTPRATHDIDLVINASPGSLDRLVAILADDEMYVDPGVAREELQRSGQFNVVDPETAWKADLAYMESWIDALGVRRLWELVQNHSAS